MFFDQFSKIWTFQIRLLFSDSKKVSSLLELTAREVSALILFKQVEEYPELFLDILWPIFKNHNFSNPSSFSDSGKVLSLLELSAREVAASIPFELVEEYPEPVPEQLQLRIAYWSFPEQEEDIRLYSCLANGSADEFTKGEYLLKNKAVKDIMQIGFHLSATVFPGNGKPSLSTSVTFDRKKIVSCQCNCHSSAEWCAHVVALCLYRIHQVRKVTI